MTLELIKAEAFKDEIEKLSAFDLVTLKKVLKKGVDGTIKPVTNGIKNVSQSIAKPDNQSLLNGIFTR